MSKTVEELRTWLDRRLGSREGFDVLWQQLEKEHYVGEFRQGDVNEEEILRKAREKLSVARELVYAFDGQVSAPHKQRDDEKEGGASSSKPDERYFDVDLSDYERERARAYEEILAREAALNQGPNGSFPIKDWRRTFLGEELLSAEEAQRFLESPATRFFQHGMFEAWGIPLIGHEAEVFEYDAGAEKPYIDHRATIKINPPSLTKTVYYADPEIAGFDPEAIDWHWYWHRGTKDNGVRPEERMLFYKDRDGLKEKMWVWPGSVLDSLRYLSSHWAKILGWKEEDMTMWLLTGEPAKWEPLQVKLSFKTGRPTTASLTIHPWMPAETVARNYRKLQHQLFGQDNRPLQSRSLAVLRFVERRIKECHGKRPSWSRLVNEWNEQSVPDWRYDNRSNLARTYREALHSVAHSSYSIPERKISPAAKRKAARLSAEARERTERLLRSLVKNGYTMRKYDLHGNLFSENETPPMQAQTDDTQKSEGRQSSGAV